MKMRNAVIVLASLVISLCETRESAASNADTGIALREISRRRANAASLPPNVKALSRGADALSRNAGILTGNIETLSGNVEAPSPNVETLSRDVDALSVNVDVVTGFANPIPSATCTSKSTSTERP